MSVSIRANRQDASLKQIAEMLKEYAKKHPQAVVEAYRFNSVSVRIRIVNSDFQGKTRSDREQEIWALLDTLPDDVASEISILLLLTPKEAKASFASEEFDHPLPSKL